MGIWQLFGLVSVLGKKICSVYPQLGNPVVRNDLNRIIMPREMRFGEQVYIMWTSTREDMVNRHWVPNHVVPVLPII